MPHSGTRVKLEKNSLFLNYCASIQKLQLPDIVRDLEVNAAGHFTYSRFLTYSENQFDFCIFRLYTVISLHFKNIKKQ